MEHLPIPRRPIRPHPDIPLASKQFADPGPFLTYPDRFGTLLKGSYPGVPTQADALLGRRPATVSSIDILDYYQGWLFFSLLSEFLGPLFDPGKYLRVVENAGNEGGDAQNGTPKEIYLSTKQLHKDLAVLRSAGALSRVRVGDDHHQHLEACLDAAAMALDDAEARFNGIMKLYPDQFLCWASVAETLDIALTTALELRPHETAGPQELPSLARRRWLSKAIQILDIENSESHLRARMLEAGWCPGDISRTAETFQSIAAYYYFSNFQPDPSNPNLHKSCPSYGCTLSSPAEPRHMKADCGCPGMLTLPEEALIDIYKRNCIPCFTIGSVQGGGLGIALSAISLDSDAQRDPRNRYVALSHVWSEGMGNPAANSLPLCQLATVQYWAAMAQKLVEPADVDEPAHTTDIHVSGEPDSLAVNLWIDTMCCPATPGYGKNLCLARMRDIYANAHAVLVKSAALEHISLRTCLGDPENGVLDVAAQLYLAPWMRRMWTLQEAVLAGVRKRQSVIGQRLVLGFSDGVLSLESIIGLLKRSPLHERAVGFSIIGGLMQITSTQYSTDIDDDGWVRDPRSNSFLWAMSRALKYRSVSVPSDELVCLATLMGLKVKSSGCAVPLVGEGKKPEEGMCELWRRIEKLNKGVPGDIIFSSVPRINVDGFRWAPRTFIQHGKYGKMFWSSRGEDLARISNDGLQVRYPALGLIALDTPELYGSYLLRTYGERQALQGEHANNPIVMFRVQSGDERWYFIHLRYPAASVRPPKIDIGNLIRNGNMALLLREPAPSGDGLLVTIMEETPFHALDNTMPQRVRSECPVAIRRFSPSASLIISTVHQHLKTLRLAVDAAGGDDKLGEAILRQKLSELLSGSKQLETALLFETLDKVRVSASRDQVLDKFLDYANWFARYGVLVRTLATEKRMWVVD